MDVLEAQRSFYANFIVRSGGSGDARLIDAFERVAREDFLGPGPWQVFVGSGYLATPDADPRAVNQDVLVGLAPERRINNGQPSLHARCLAAAAPQPGESVVHIGAGTGYYTAVLARLVAPTGRVLALEIEADLAAAAGRNLSRYPNVVVETRSAGASPLPKCDVLYVNAGATHVPSDWLDALNVGGRLLMPLTPREGFGVMLRITHASPGAYSAAALSRVAFIPCVGESVDAESASLAAALECRPLREVRSLRRGTPPDSSAWCAGSGWWLSTSEP